ncbi:Clp protease N-terminal domain-containing protein [Nonomuraea endophytica]|uniref:ATP-dependent Clp protease ATP-binding subunit ClpA n=1 Tax=Nonomuraea endophytica TaxID=714136 RepID=A0A7W8A4P5_9ACTN|nr:Clp protease N-terminal domain-containing protein [Nonomuraea endophytica]MBB5078800.1 ATP-dependent Clp protease ATP-binding subunit ClpA [Nonomuraea endophytica]
MFASEKSPFATAVKAAAQEARQRGDRRIGTEHLLLGLLSDPGSTTSRALGVDLATARAALADLDTAALRAIGLDVGQAPRTEPRRHPPVPVSALATGARAAVNHAIKTTTRKNRNAQAPVRLLLALLAQREPDPVAQLLNHLGVDRAAVHAHLDQVSAS